ncbi:MAG: SEC59/DGK1/VTE5 family protein [Methanobrevibacter sp.]|uniref:diacylglycerol/polyprenol kinase family protein n=1 Tax=Methanobrevibacter sp. TaxID=66852 RepID=UPI0026DF02CD|nr:diacylglycerol/polyprenol kinase family protein [Methanobrevibacter sp.]MDO5849242.1 SEC59/DGK1/VTE5 family protein [Methanobrevibacter sp.]
MDFYDIIPLIIVYVYVAIVFVSSEKFLKHKPELSRKFLHIMVGNCIFIMPFFKDPMVMVYFLTLPLTVFAFLLTKYSPIQIQNTATEAGHDLGLVYYAGIWTILIFLLPNHLWIVALAIASMVYGDGFASVVGQQYGKHKYNISGDPKSVEGSITMFIVIILASIVVFAFYNAIGYPSTPALNIPIIILMSLIATVAEASTPKGLDNVSVCIVTAILYYVIMVVF